MKKVSVIMAAYNAQAYIAEAIGSVLAQTYPELELIVVDDGSTDATREIARACAARDGRVRVLTPPRCGHPAGARNSGLRVATGEFISFLDADDVYFPDRTALLVEGLERNPHWVAAFHDLLLTDARLEPLPGTFLSNVHFKERARSVLVAEPVGQEVGGWFHCGARFNVFQCIHFAGFSTQSVLIARDRIDLKVLYFDERYLIGEDNDLWIRVGRQGPVGYLDRILSKYRQHQSSLTRDKVRHYQDFVAIHRSHYRLMRNEMTLTERKQYRRKIASGFDELAFAYIRKGNLDPARQALAWSLLWRPRRSTFASLLKSLLPASLRRRILMLLGREEQQGW